VEEHLSYAEFAQIIFFFDKNKMKKSMKKF
jgi:hypothetical protein